MPPIHLQDFKNIASTQPSASAIRLDAAGQLVARASGHASRIGRWFGEVFGVGKSRNRAAIDAFVDSVRAERGPAAADIARAYLARRRERGQPLAPRHIEAGLKLTGVVVRGAKTFTDALLALGVGDRDFRKIGEGGEGKAYEVRIRVGNESMERIMKTHNAGRPLRLDPGLGTVGKAQRRGETAAAYIGDDIPGLIRPDFYIVHHAPAQDKAPDQMESDPYEAVARSLQQLDGDRADGTGPAQGAEGSDKVRRGASAGGKPQFSVVAGGKRFRAWATERLLANERPVLTGVIMPKAHGAPLTDLARIGEFARDDSAPSNEPAHLMQATRAGLATLAGMARYGMRHGDIKPENVRFDSSRGAFELFDQGSMVKISKSEQEAPPLSGGVTPLYQAPAFDQTDGAGCEYDLFATGVMMLEASLRARGLHDVAQLLLATVKDKAENGLGLADFHQFLVANGEGAQAQASQMNARSVLKLRIHEEVGKHVGDQTPAAQVALQLIDAALDQRAPVTQRYDPVRPEGHPFARFYAMASST